MALFTETGNMLGLGELHEEYAELSLANTEFEILLSDRQAVSEKATLCVSGSLAFGGR